MSYSTKYKIIKENVNGNTQFGLLISRNNTKVYINKISSDKSKVKNMIYMFKNLLDVEDATCLNGWSINQNLRFEDMFINTGLTSSTKPTWYTGNI